MELVLLTIQIISAIAIIFLVIIQNSEQDGFGLGSGGGGAGLMTSKGAANALTKATKWAAVIFMVCSLALSAISVRKNNVPIIEDENIIPLEDSINKNSSEENSATTEKINSDKINNEGVPLE